LGLTRELCTIIDATRYETLGADCIYRVKQAIKDGIAVALAGRTEPPVQILAAHMLELGGAPQASIWGTAHKVAVTQAAYVNAAATHVLDFEPMWSPPTHSVSPTVPVAFALAQAHKVTGKEIVTAVAKGIETQGRLQYAGDQYVPEQLIFHPPGFAGIMSSVVTASELLHLELDRLQHALGIAASRAGALLANVGSMTKCTHCGNAAGGGLDAALLAQKGFTGNPDVLEAHKGFIQTFYPKRFDVDRLLGYGNPFRIVDPGLAIKLFPSQFGTHYVITAGLDVHRALPKGARIARVHIVTPVMKYVDRPQPVTGLAGKFSLQYGTAAALLDGTVKIDTFTNERRFRQDMVDLLAKTEITQDETIQGDFHHMWVKVAVELEDGTRHESICRGPRGSWGAPPMTDADHREKLQDCLIRALPQPRIDELLGLLDRLDELDAAEVQKVTTLIGSA
jgi:2-methylcitrate dehydratase PrpD